MCIKYYCIHDRYSKPIINKINSNTVLKETIQLIEEYVKESYKLINKYKTTKFMRITKEQEKFIIV